MLYIALIVIIACIILIDLYFKKRKKDISKKLLKKTFTDSFDRNILMVLIFSAGTFFYLADNYESIKEYAVKFSFSTNIENSAPETLREIYDDAISKNSSTLIEKLIEENPDNSELHALAAYYFENEDEDKDKNEEFPKKIIYHATQAINMGSNYEPWLLKIRGFYKYVLKDNTAKRDLKKAISLFEISLESNPEDANLLFDLGEIKCWENGVYQQKFVDVCAASSPRFIIPMEYFKQALNNSSKNDPYTNMFGWERGNLHDKIYNGLEWNARINIGVRVNRDSDYDNFVASRYSKTCGGRYVELESEMSSNGFCDIFSNAGGEGYEEAYDVIQKWCN